MSDLTMSTGPLAHATSLGDIPEHRRPALVKRIRRGMPGVDAAGIDAFIAEHGPTPCRVPPPGPLLYDQADAVLGDDGRYHLVVGDIVRCADARPRRARGRPRASAKDGVHVHQQLCHWWTDGTRYLAQPPYASFPTRDQIGTRVVTWNVTLTDTITSPALVPPRRRCAPTTTGPLLDWWPPVPNLATTKGRLRARLIEEFGNACQACGRYYGVNIDHHHGTRLVRGLLCRHCNSHVDGCLHLAGCTWGAYLDNPPAAHLRLRYPR